MGSDRDLAAIFTVLLFGVVWPAGCADTGYGGVCYTPKRRYVESAALASALKDDKLSDAECIELCLGSSPDPPSPSMSEPTSSADADTCHDTTTGNDTATDTGTNTGDSTTSGSTTSDSTTSDSTTSDLTTSGSTTSGSTGGTGTAADSGSTSEVCSEAGPDPVQDHFDGSNVHSCVLNENAVDSIYCNVVDCSYGRRPMGLRSAGRAVGAGTLGSWLAEGAHFEAASVPAFQRLAAALVEHGAPPELVRRALVAADDERRHAEQMTTLAAEFGSTPATPELDPVPVPTLLELARDNAMQGCVGETWAALIARHQAEVAVWPQIRRVMAEIAADETEHAELAWAIDAWLQTRLDSAGRAEVLAVRATACEALREQLNRKPDHPELQDAGVPRRATALALYGGLSRALWSASNHSPLSA